MISEGICHDSTVMPGVVEVLDEVDPRFDVLLGVGSRGRSARLARGTRSGLNGYRRLLTTA